jgi:hypothetical protein
MPSSEVHHDPLTAVDQLGIGGLQIHHQVAVGLAEADHGAGREGVEHQLGGRPRLHPGGPGHDFRPGPQHDADIAGLAQER